MWKDSSKIGLNAKSKVGPNLAPLPLPYISPKNVLPFFVQRPGNRVYLSSIDS